MLAEIKTNYIPIQDYGTLPNGVHIIEIPCQDYETKKRLPRAIEYQGRLYGCSGWNSDRCVAYYRTDCDVAKVLCY